MCVVINALVPLLTEYEWFHCFIRHVDSTHVNTPPKCDNSEEVDEVTDMLASGLTIDDNPDSTSSLPSSDVMEGDFVNITNKPDTRESNDNR